MQFNVFIGRFQPAHRAHLTIMKGALHAKYNKEKYHVNPNQLIIVIGSANAPRDPKNPFSFNEREEMIRSVFTEEENQRVDIVGVSDSLYSDNQWLEDVQQQVNQIVDGYCVEEKEIRLVGHKKDDSSFYLDMFPQWKQIGISNIDNLHSTSIRDYLFNKKWQEYDVNDVFTEMCEEYLDPSIYQWLLNFRTTKEFQILEDEFTFLEDHHAQWEGSPYAPTFNTADAVLIQSGHLLLIQRDRAPGAGLWALPGGYVDLEDETRLDTCIRELREETKLKVPEGVLRGSIKNDHEFGHPNRSLRGRIFTRAFHIQLNPGPLPKVRGSDDARKAKWFPLSEVKTMDSMMFEDHLSIIKYFV